MNEQPSEIGPLGEIRTLYARLRSAVPVRSRIEEFENWYAGEESNLHSFRNLGLSQTRLPLRHQRTEIRASTYQRADALSA